MSVFCALSNSLVADVEGFKLPYAPWKRAYSSLRSIANPLPATFLRGGTSKGIFIKRADLPEDRSEWDRIFLGIMGSPDPEYGRQLNGMGGGVSSLSKICVVGPASDAQRADGVDVEYTFVQVGIRDSVLDYSGNCGNLSSMIGVFAMDEGICAASFVDRKSNAASVRSFNTNTKKRVDTTFPISTSHEGIVPDLEMEQVAMAGVPGKASQIVLEFVSPGGARTGRLLPTGRPKDALIFKVLGHPYSIPASLVDATNPTIFVASTDLRTILGVPSQSPIIDYSDDVVLEFLEAIRHEGARQMGLNPAAQAQPKIAILSHCMVEGKVSDADIAIHALSMGVLHKAVPMTVGLCLGVAAGIKGTLAQDIVSQGRAHKAAENPSLIRIRHPGGLVDVGADFNSNGTVKSAKVVRTGRRLMKGAVWW
ncbi:hypothetical protein EIP91_009305 [Steccherinum ochraceum]|uniref:DUF453-domain-containing protein n=1 Tax=Steccherinum ochraceum TaxID=92696 RepID=A0A4R0REQ1_9APHY|nr:hypothetical protein EIP91_009305 [Steccherinum ochraceum]